jgi:16S rRNA (guanine966-N2)-methyltransferase
VPEAPFDLVFLDPPYDLAGDEVAGVLASLAARDLVAPGGTVVVERAKAGDAVTLPEGWGTEKARAYGDTLLVVAHAG